MAREKSKLDDAAAKKELKALRQEQVNARMAGYLISEINSLLHYLVKNYKPELHTKQPSAG